MQTIVEFPEYQRKANVLLDVEAREEIVAHLARHPAAGVILQGASGIRKLRWSAKGKGKSGGVRVIYYYHNEELPLFLLTVFSKSDEPNLGKARRNELAMLIHQLVRSYGH